ncbi:MAG: NUDIX hydrolase [Clostridia bacterium]|nr:NUDIX hydrolase [Clostridia bacterium]MBQ6803397.1 NUDIX hydrolase [Clostridia bacterium]
MLDDKLRENFLSGEEIYNGKIIKVERWQVSLPNGQTAPREIVRHNGAAAIVPIDAAGNVTLVRQYRVAVGRFTWEIPAGKLDSPDEDPFHAARRELEEETGLQAENWQLLNRIDTTPGFCTERIAIYLATGLSQQNAHPDEDEFLGLTKMPLDEAVALCMAGEIHDSKTLVGLLMAQKALAKTDMPSVPLHAPIQRGMVIPSSQNGKEI